MPLPAGATPDSVRAWFDRAVDTSEPVLDGTLASERDAADIPAAQRASQGYCYPGSLSSTTQTTRP